MFAQSSRMTGDNRSALFHQAWLQLGDVMNPAAVHTLLQLPPDPVVDWVEVRTIGWPGRELDAMKSGVVALSHRIQLSTGVPHWGPAPAGHCGRQAKKIHRTCTAPASLQREEVEDGAGQSGHGRRHLEKIRMKWVSVTVWHSWRSQKCWLDSDRTRCTNRPQTEMFSHRYLKINNSAAKEYVLAKLLFVRWYIHNPVCVILLGCVEM